MKQIQNNVLQVIQGFVDKKECFTSLDVYCMLGIRFNDDSYPIYQQVADAYRAGLMGNYLVEMTRINLEHGSTCNVWRYYLPKSEKKEFTCKADPSLKLTAEILGHFPLLDINMEMICMDGLIRLIPTTKQSSAGYDYGYYVQNTSNGVLIPFEVLKNHKLDKEQLKVTIYQNKIEITE
jgi:hypothetical protein